MTPHEMLTKLAHTHHLSDNQFSIIYQKPTTTTTAGWRDIEEDPDISNYVSSCTAGKGATATALLVSITNNHPHLQRLEDQSTTSQSALLEDGTFFVTNSVV